MDFKYANKVKGMGESNNKVHFDWGVNITDAEKVILAKHITSLTKWKARVTEILDNPPRDPEAEMDALKARIIGLENPV